MSRVGVDVHLGYAPMAETGWYHAAIKGIATIKRDLHLRGQIACRAPKVKPEPWMKRCESRGPFLLILAWVPYASGLLPAGWTLRIDTIARARKATK